MKNTGKLFTVGISDAVKGLIVSVLTVLISMLGSSISNGVFPDTWEDWKVILLASLGAGLSYILKNWLTNSDDQFLKKEVGE